jgi:CheY-like chemotaxis protein
LGQQIKRVLVVDDERVIAETLVQILELKGYEAVAAYSGEEAVTTASTFRPDFAIMDVIMGELNGFEAALLIRKLLPACQITMVSGQQETADLLNHTLAAGNEFEVLAKPVYPQILLDGLARGKDVVPPPSMDN